MWRRFSTTILTRGGYTVDRELDDMVTWTTARGRSKILDLGCGSGHYVRALSARSSTSTLVGVDESAAFLRQAVRTSAQTRPSARWVWASALDLPFVDGWFDAVACGGTPNEFRDPRQAFREARRVTNAGGHGWWMMAARGDARSPGRRGVGSWAGLWIPRVAEALGLLEETGWSIVRAEIRPPLLIVRTVAIDRP